MRINTLSAVGGIIGVVLMLSSWIRYFILYPDLDKAIIYVGVGALVVCVSYLWDKIVQLQNTVYDIEVWLSEQNKDDDDE